MKIDSFYLGMVLWELLMVIAFFVFGCIFLYVDELCWGILLLLISIGKCFLFATYLKKAWGIE